MYDLILSCISFIVSPPATDAVPAPLPPTVTVVISLFESASSVKVVGIAIVLFVI